MSYLRDEDLIAIEFNLPPRSARLAEVLRGTLCGVERASDCVAEDADSYRVELVRSAIRAKQTGKN